MTKSNRWLGAGALCALLAVIGCTPNGNSNGGSNAQQPYSQQPNANNPSGPTQRGITAPVILSLRGPTPAPAGGNITLDLEISVHEPINAPVTLNVALPQGAQLMSGQPQEILSLPQPGKLYRQYVVYAPGPLSQPVHVEAIATGPNNAWGFRAHQHYPAASDNLPPYPRRPSMGRPPAVRP